MSPESFNAAEDAVARLKQGDPHAIAEILTRYHHRLYRFLLRIVKDQATAEDLFQQTWLRLMEKIGRYDARVSFETWMFTVARNLAIDHLRRQRTTSLDAPDEFGVAPVERLASDAQDALHRLLEYECGQLLAAAISELPVIHREVLSLRFEEEMKLEQIAEVTGLPLSTVKSRLSRALENLRIKAESRFRRGRKS